MHAGRCEAILEQLRSEIAEMKSELDSVRDHMAIRECLQRYVRGLDRHDVNLEKSAFWSDAQINYGSRFSGGREAFIERGNNWHAERYELHQHHLTSYTIEIDGDEAHVESYLIHIMRRRDGMQDIGSGRYVDRLVKRNGLWKILVREFVAEGRMEAESIFDYSSIVSRSESRQNRNDVSYMRPLPFRLV